jgi:hypothetical protein
LGSSKTAEIAAQGIAHGSPEEFFNFSMNA